MGSSRSPKKRKEKDKERRRSSRSPHWHVQPACLPGPQSPPSSPHTHLPTAITMPPHVMGDSAYPPLSPHHAPTCDVR